VLCRPQTVKPRGLTPRYFTWITRVWRFRSLAP